MSSIMPRKDGTGLLLDRACWDALRSQMLPVGSASRKERDTRLGNNFAKRMKGSLELNFAGGIRRKIEARNPD